MDQKSPEATTRVGGAPYPPGHALHHCGRIVAPPTSSPSLLVVLSSGPRKIIAMVLFRLDSVWYSFSAELKNKEKKQKLALGSRLIG